MRHIEQTIEELESQICQKQKELLGLQIAVNNLCKLLEPDAEPRYRIEEQNKEMPAIRLKGDEYFRRPTATVITRILEDRKKRSMGPATIDEIHEKMTEGGYVFDVKDPRKSIATAMGKNPKFTRLDNDKWGLTEWYPPGKAEKEDTSKKDKASRPETPRRRGRPRKQPLAPERNGGEKISQKESQNENSESTEEQ
jgi:DNA-directed RNA polymerase delta subunit